MKKWETITHTRICPPQTLWKPSLKAVNWEWTERFNMQSTYKSTYSFLWHEYNRKKWLIANRRQCIKILSFLTFTDNSWRSYHKQIYISSPPYLNTLTTRSSKPKMIYTQLKVQKRNIWKLKTICFKTWTVTWKFERIFNTILNHENFAKGTYLFSWVTVFVSPSGHSATVLISPNISWLIWNVAVH